MAQRGRPRKSAITEQEVPQEQPQEEVEQSRPSAANPRSGRTKRVPINGYRDILKVGGEDPNYHYAWIRDDLIPRFESAEYEYVTHAVTVGDRKINQASQMGSKVSIPGGNGRMMFLMRQLKEYYNEDMAAYHHQIDEDEAAMFGNLSREAGRYGEVSSSVTKSYKGQRVS